MSKTLPKNPKKPQTRPLIAETLEERLPVSSAAGVLFGLGFAQNPTPACEVPARPTPLPDLTPNLIAVNPLDIQLDAIAVDHVHAEEASSGVISAVADDPFILTPLTHDVALDDTIPDTRRELGNELLLMEIAKTETIFTSFAAPGLVNGNHAAGGVSMASHEPVFVQLEAVTVAMTPFSAALSMSPGGGTRVDFSFFWVGNQSALPSPWTTPAVYLLGSQTASIDVSIEWINLLYYDPNHGMEFAYADQSSTLDVWLECHTPFTDSDGKPLEDTTYWTYNTPITSPDSMSTWTWECPPGVAIENAVRDFTFVLYARFVNWADGYGNMIGGAEGVTGSISIDVHVGYEGSAKLALETVKFQGDLEMIADPGLPEWDRSVDWKKGDVTQTNAIAYENGAGSLTVDAAFSSKSIPPESLVEVRFAALGFPGGVIESGWTGLAQTGVNTYSAVGVTALQTFLANYCTLQPDFIEQMELEWEFRVNGGTEKAVNGVSLNPFYVTSGAATEAYHTVVHVGSAAAKGQTTEDTVFDAIWGKFAGLNIDSVKVENGVVVDHAILTYYGKEPNDSSHNDPNSIESKKLYAELDTNGDFVFVQSVSRARECFVYEEPVLIKALLKSSDGTCDGWQQFMIAVLAVQGIASTPITITAHEFDNDANAFKINPNHKGQGNVNPKKFMFRQHMVVEYAGNIYDPSYGFE